MSEHAYMRVWAVIETADYQTVHLFQTEALADEWVEREEAKIRALYARINTPRMTGPAYVVSEEEVLDSLPPSE